MDTTKAITEFACTSCGKCCRWPGHVLLTPGDITALSAALGMPENEFIQRHTTLAVNRSQLTLIEQADGACCFLTADSKCRIYSARPRQCRDFPLGWRTTGCPSLGAP